MRCFFTICSETVFTGNICTGGPLSKAIGGFARHYAGAYVEAHVTGRISWSPAKADTSSPMDVFKTG